MCLGDLVVNLIVPQRQDVLPQDVQRRGRQFPQLVLLDFAAGRRRIFVDKKEERRNLVKGDLSVTEGLHLRFIGGDAKISSI